MTPSRRSYVLLLILASIVISTALGLRQSLGLFMQPMVAGFGISAASFGFAIALQNLVWGLSQPLVGALADRHGARPVVMGTALVYALGLLLMLFANDIPAGLQIAGFLTGIGIAGTGFGVLIGSVTRAAPPERRTQTVPRGHLDEACRAVLDAIGDVPPSPLEWSTRLRRLTAAADTR